MSGSREDRWQHLVSGAFALDEKRPKGKKRAANTRDAIAYLESVLEVFPPSVDPLEDFEGYAVRRAALALLGALDPKR